MKIDKNALNILNSYIRVCENHPEKLQLALLETKNHVPFTSESFEKINAVDTSFLKVATSHFAKIIFVLNLCSKLLHFCVTMSKYFSSRLLEKGLMRTKDFVQVLPAQLRTLSSLK